MKHTKNYRKKRGFLPVFLLLIFIISLSSCGFLIYMEINKELKIKDMEEDIQTFVTPTKQETMDDGILDMETEPEETEPEETESEEITDQSEEYETMFDWNGISESSDYAIGWIQIPGIERLNYPIVQHPEDNQFFLTHDWTGAAQSAGAIFMNRHNASDFTDMNSVIYGHRMKNGSMFGSLKKYASQEFLDENPCFYIYTPDGKKMTYDIICYSSVTDGSDAYLMHFNSPNERIAYYDMMIDSAITKRNIDLGKFDTTIMLSFCNTTGYYDRLVVLGKLTDIDLDGQIIK